MLLSPQQEELCVKWLFSEAISYKNKRRSVSNPYHLKWATHTRMHKILFGVLEEFNIPVTRSWYKWGGFIHSSLLNNQSFTGFRHDYSVNPQRSNNFRKKVSALGIRVDDIIGYLEKRVDLVKSMPSSEFLLRHYREETPLEYRDLYVAKQILSNSFYDLFNLHNMNKFKSRYEKIVNSINQFHEHTSDIFEDEIIRESNFRFTDLIENALDKISIILLDGKGISKKKLLFFKNAKNVFDNFIWNPYACEISQKTLKGIRAEEQKEVMIRQKEQRIKRIEPEVGALESEFEERNFTYSFEELRKLKELTFKDRETAKVLADIIQVYNRADGD